MTDEAPVPTLDERLASIRHKLSGIAKAGHNDAHGYDYVKAEDVVRAVREELHAARVGFTVESAEPEQFTETGGKQFVTTLKLVYRLVNLDKPDDWRSFLWVGAGADVGGDKGLYKAYTGGLKYFLLNLFLIPTGDDPEADATTDAVQERPAAPLIPRDRAERILKRAVEVKLASWESGGQPALEPVLLAKLADVGVTTGKLGHLTVDQAEGVEVFIEEEAKAHA